mgnify:FL=1
MTTIPKQPMFQKRHYDAIASVLRNVKQQQYTDLYAVDNVVRRLANLFDADNVHFDRGRFEQACCGACEP